MRVALLPVAALLLVLPCLALAADVANPPDMPAAESASPKFQDQGKENPAMAPGKMPKKKKKYSGPVPALKTTPKDKTPQPRK